MSLVEHFGHSVAIVRYFGVDDRPINYSLECQECFEVIIDEEVE